MDHNIDIVFGLYSGYNSLKTDSGGIYYFIKSLRKYNKDCKIVILCCKNKIFQELIDFSKEMNFEIYDNFTVKYNLLFYRFEIYKKYLEESNIKYRKILLSDINDVIFQEDPFSIIFSEDIYCALEQNIFSDITNSSSKLNISWISQIQQCNNDPRKYLNQYIVCAGTILGTYKGIIDYLDFYQKTITQKIVNDQGLYNVYVYNYLKSKKMMGYKKSKILTLDKIQFNKLKFSKDGSIINDNTEKYAIIHQINRCNLPYMLKLVK